MTQLPLRPNVCLLIVNQEGKLLLAERNGWPGVWQLPQGGIDPGRSIAEAALQEAHEELGAPAERFKLLAVLAARNEYEYDVPPPRAAGRWRGQSQRFCVLQYLGRDEEIDPARYDQELMAWRWCTAEEVRQQAEPKRARGYAAALAEFEDWARRNPAACRGG